MCFARKKLHRRAQINEEIYRPRCNTDPGLNEGEKFLRPLNIPILRIPEDDNSMCNDIMPTGDTLRPSTPSGCSERAPSPSPSLMPGERKRSGSSSSNSGVLGSLLKQTIKVTTASMGFRAASMERYVECIYMCMYVLMLLVL